MFCFFIQLYYIMQQLEREWQESGKKGALPTLEENASKEIDWEQLEELAAQGKVTIFGGRPKSD